MSDREMPPESRGSIGTTFKRLIKRFILPSNAGPLDDAIILDPAPTGCLGTRYAAVIVFRQNSPLVRGQGFIGIVKSNLVPRASETYVERGFMKDDGVSCWVVVTGRWASDMSTPVVGGVQFREEIGNLVNIGAPPPNPFRLFVNRSLASFRAKCINELCVPGNTASTAFVDFPISNPFPAFEKYDEESQLLIRFSPSYFNDNANTGGVFAVRIDGIDYQTSSMAGPVPGPFVRHKDYGEVIVGGIASGNKTIRARWARYFSGAGNMFVDSNDSYTLTVQEVSAQLF